MGIRQLDFFDEIGDGNIDSGCGFSCASCGLKTDETLTCPNCLLKHNEFGEKKETGEDFDFMDGIKDNSKKLSIGYYTIGPIGNFTTPATQWNRENTALVEITNIKGLKGKFQELEIKFGTSYIKVDTNGEVIKNYRSKKATKNRRGKGFKWERKNPSSLIKAFLEDKLSAKFA